ncbi:MAG TPA: MGMT family protein [Steroidobacteraceae bacterium]|nr:MGMT family protein [Steroidobacteraceae bacterium]
MSPLIRRARPSARSLLAPPMRGGSRSVIDRSAAALEPIWNVVCAIPRGSASTYGAVARAAGLPGRARLVGFALRVAPAELNLPWHRVVAAQGRIAFPRGSQHFREQVRRLRAEGVRVEKGRVAAAALELFGPP